MEPYTEAANILTECIDISTPDEIVDKLRMCDMEMFTPQQLDKSTKTLFHEEIDKVIVKVSEIVREGLKRPDAIVVLSGCGTSGRIAFLIARKFNQYLKTNFSKITYTIAGGDKSLLTSQEAPEDDHVAGVADLCKACGGKESVIYIGITCGLSAPYVAGQLDHCMNNPDRFIPVLIGFNPIMLARNIPIPAWEKTFFDVARRLEFFALEHRAYIINPVLAGEAITGSSRMKGGSVTKIILEAIFLMAAGSASSWSTNSCKNLLSSYLEACRQLYCSQSSMISNLLSLAGDSLKYSGHFYQLATNGIGVLAIIDATECPPTYSAALDDIRGFIYGGYKEYGNLEGDLSHEGNEFCIDVSDFVKALKTETFNELKDNILLVCTAEDPLLNQIHESQRIGQSLKDLCMKRKTSVSLVLMLAESEEAPELPTYLSSVFTFRLNVSTLLTSETTELLSEGGQKLIIGCWKEICAKLIFNNISTGSHIIKGKVLKNYMVDLKVSNQKLFRRSIGIIKKFSAEINVVEAKEFLLKSIYEVDLLDQNIMSDNVTNHIKVATSKDKVVPKAIFMAIKKCKFAEADSALLQVQCLREALALAYGV